MTARTDRAVEPPPGKPGLVALPVAVDSDEAATILGTIIIYVAREPEGVERAAIVTGIVDAAENVVDGTVFVNEGRELHDHVERFFLDAPYDINGAPGTWHFKPEVQSDGG